jgi:hypothetical protein
MAGISLANLDLGTVLTGAGTLLKDIRTAITGKEPLSANKAAEIALEAEKIEAVIETARVSVMVAEAQSQDKWTSRARPAFLYVMYIMILTSIPMGIIYAVNPVVAANLTSGVKAWLLVIPESMWALMGAGYLGYVGARSYDKKQGVI